MCFVIVKMEEGSKESSEVQQVATAVTLMAPGSLQKDQRAACRTIRRQSTDCTLRCVNLRSFALASAAVYLKAPMHDACC